MRRTFVEGKPAGWHHVGIRLHCRYGIWIDHWHGSIMNILQQADQAINGDRAAAYGDAKAGFEKIAMQWAIFIHQKYGITVSLTAEDVCWMMTDLKKVRQMNSARRDNVMDAAGYIGLIEKVTDLK